MSRELLERIAELERIVRNMLIIGTVKEVKKNKVKVVSGDFISPLVTCFQPAAGDDQEFNPISKGEMVMLLSPSGDPSAGFAIRGAAYSGKPLASEAADDVFVKKFSDGSKITYNKSTHELNADIKGKIIIKNYSSIEVEAAAEMSFKNAVSEIKIGVGTIELKGIPGPTFGVLTEMSKCPVFGVSMLPPSFTVKASL